MRAGDGQKPLSPKREGWWLLSRLAPQRPMEKKGGGAGQGGRQSGQAGEGHGGWRAALARPARPQPPTKRVEKGRARPLCAPFGVPPRRLPCPLKQPGMLCQGDVFVVLGQAASWRRRAPARRIKKPWRVDGLMGWREQRGRGRGGGGPLPPQSEPPGEPPRLSPLTFHAPFTSRTQTPGVWSQGGGGPAGGAGRGVWSPSPSPSA